MSNYAWEPTPEYVEQANVTRLMRANGIEDLEVLRNRAVEDPEWYWDAVVKDLDIRFFDPYSTVRTPQEQPTPDLWFADGGINVTDACVDRHATDPQRADQTALIGESEDGEVRTLTYRELAREVDAVARGLLAEGVGKGDTVAVFMPMVPEAVIAAYAIAKIGAIYVPIFSGFAASAIASRLVDSGCPVVLTADGTWRRGKHGAMKPVLDEAVAQAPAVRRVVVLDRLGLEVPFDSGRDVTWDAFTAPHRSDEPLACEPTRAEDGFMLAYTSGTTGKPKGVFHVHGGFTVKIASEVAYQNDLHAGEVLYWVTDMGWIMGAWSMVGAHAIGGTMVMYEGAPDFPNPDRTWEMAERHKVAMLGISPTLIRALRAKGDNWHHDHDLSSVRILGSTGEPWNPEPYKWLSDEVFGGRVPIINISGGTEVGACFLSPYPVEPIKECSLGGASIGMDIDVFDPEGNSLRGAVGELVCKSDWPGMARSIWGDHDRFAATYYSTYPNIWRHGDWAKIDEDGQWYLLGRSDEAINVAGKRLGPAEVESILVGHPSVQEAATIGFPDSTKGEAIWCFWVPAEPGGDDVSAELTVRVADELGKPFKPSRVVMVEALPKTRSAKILRRAIKAVATGEDPGDLSSAENPGSLDQIKQALEA